MYIEEHYAKGWMVVMRKARRTYRKGFTVAELLIVVAIVTVLVAISIPAFMKYAEKAREAYDIYTMRQAASAAIQLYYAGVTNQASATAAGLSWSNDGGNEGHNAYGAYDPRSGTFYKSRDALPAAVKTYGKGTERDGGTLYIMGNPRGAYSSTSDYRKACVMVSIYPDANPKHVDIYWKTNISSAIAPYIGGQYQRNIPNYSIRIELP